MSAGQTIMTFGKYRGRALSELRTLDPSYLEWLADSERDIHEAAKAREFVREIVYEPSAPGRLPTTAPLGFAVPECFRAPGDVMRERILDWYRRWFR